MVGRFLTGSGKRPAGGGEVAAPGGRRRKSGSFGGKARIVKWASGIGLLTQAKGRLFELAFFPSRGPLESRIPTQPLIPSSKSLLSRSILSMNLLLSCEILFIIGTKPLQFAHGKVLAKVWQWHYSFACGRLTVLIMGLTETLANLVRERLPL
jgi:hypothetical protein